MAALYISIDRMLLQVPTLDNAVPLLAMVIATAFYLHHIGVADQDLVNGSLQAQRPVIECLPSF